MSELWIQPTGAALAADVTAGYVSGRTAYR